MVIGPGVIQNPDLSVARTGGVTIGDALLITM